MLSKEDIDHLATLARMEIADMEKEEFATKLGSILSYVSEVSRVATKEGDTLRAGDLRNIMRPDDVTNPGGTYTDAILQNAPRSQDGYVRVRQMF